MRFAGSNFTERSVLGRCDCDSSLTFTTDYGSKGLSLQSLEFVFSGAESRAFFDPIEEIVAHDSQQVIQAFLRVEDAIANGYSVAGYASYELGRLLMGESRAGLTLPLVAFGVYRGASPSPPRMTGSATLGPLVATGNKATYERGFDAIQRALREGDVYQVNYCVAHRCTSDSDPWALFCALERQARVKYAAFVRHEGSAFLSLSPELFLQIDGDEVWVKPMKGTAPPGDLPALASDKNRAEHVMIVDLFRNDLGRVADSVNVEALFTEERYPTFHAMTSTIHAKLREGTTFYDLFEATFPCGSITGAPKISAMKIIDVIESIPRGLSMGSIGYLEPGRRGFWNVAIRTLELQDGLGTIHIGGGVVADSSLDGEMSEIALKRRVFDDLAAPFQLLETLRVDNGACASLDRHLARMISSAEALGFNITSPDLRSAFMIAIASTDRGGHLVRITLERDGSVSSTAREFRKEGPFVHVTLTPERLRSADPILRHKTSLRNAYERASAFAEAHDCFDGILLNEHGELADGARTTIFLKRDPVLLTPSLGSGALAGVLRGQLLETGAAKEARLLPKDLESGEFFVGNSAQGLLKATLVAPQIAALNKRER